MCSEFNQFNETGCLKKVIVGRYEGYQKNKAYTELVNATQQNGLPSPTQLQSEFNAFIRVLEQQGVEVLTPDYVGKFVYDQLTPRDLGVTVGHKFVLCNMAKRSRRYEAAGIFTHILPMKGEEPTILIPPSPDILLEGGDILIDKKMLFVGLSGRTNKAGFEYLKTTFSPQFEVISLSCKSNETEEILHLDCVFNPVGPNHAIIYSKGIERVPNIIYTNYNLIEINKKEQRALAANVLSVRPDLIIARDHPHCRRVNKKLRKIGIEVITLPFDGAPATGGSFRFCSLPLVRS